MSDQIRVAAQTDIGCRRKNNEDSLGYDRDLGIFAVSDGMGGSEGGEIASRLAVEELISAFRLLRSSYAGVAISLADALYHACGRANAAVHARSLGEPALRGMGATLVAMAIEGSAAVIANVGDSRAYLLRQGASTQITLDHSFVAEQVRAGVITLEEAARSPMQSTITRAIGITPSVEVDLFAAELGPGDRILLASDGLVRYVPDEEIASLAAPPVALEAACSTLIELTRSRGGADNITCLLVGWGE